MKSISKWIIVSILFTSSMEQIFAATATSRVGFANNPLSPILNPDGSYANNSVTVGLYYSGLFEPSPDDLVLAGTTPVVFSGLFNNGGSSLHLPIDLVSTGIIVEIRAWDGGYSSYEAALEDAGNTGLIGRSGLLNRMWLGYGLTPDPNLYYDGGLRSIQLHHVPEPNVTALGICGFLLYYVLKRNLLPFRRLIPKIYLKDVCLTNRLTEL